MSRFRRTTDPRCGGERGAAMVEFALLLPIFVLLIVGMIEFGLALNTQISLTGGAREGARVVAIPDFDEALAASRAKDASTPADPTVTFDYFTAAGASTSECTPGGRVRVTTTDPAAVSIPFWGSSSFTLTGVGEMRCGG